MRGRVDRGADPGDDGRLLAVVAGSLTRDRILVEGHEAETRIGGAVWYAGRTLQALGCHVRAVYRRAPRDADLDEALAEAGLSPRPEAARRTTVFELHYRGSGGALAELRAPALAEPVPAEAVVAAAAGAALLHLGPLHPQDLDPALWRRLPEGPLRGLDLQGLARAVGEDGRVRPAADASLDAALAAADVAKANAGEALLLTGAADAAAAALALARATRGGEAVVSLGADGALAARGGEHWHVAATPVEGLRETTGAGDILLAAYLARRLEGATPQQALWFAVGYTGRRLAARAAAG